jgi:hypothetical protein
MIRWFKVESKAGKVAWAALEVEGGPDGRWYRVVGQERHNGRLVADCCHESDMKANYRSIRNAAGLVVYAPARVAAKLDRVQERPAEYDPPPNDVRNPRLHLGNWTAPGSGPMVGLETPPKRTPEASAKAYDKAVQQARKARECKGCGREMTVPADKVGGYCDRCTPTVQAADRYRKEVEREGLPNGLPLWLLDLLPQTENNGG